MADPSTQDKSKRATPPASVWLLRGIHWAKGMTVRASLFGGGCMLGGLVLYPFGPSESSAVMALGAAVAIFAFCLLTFLLVLWFTVVFVYYTRYSLRALMLSVLGFGFAVCFLVMDDPVAKLVGGLLVLGGLGTLIAQVLGEFDPVGGTPAKVRTSAFNRQDGRL